MNSRSLIGFAVCVCLTTWLPSCIYFWLCNRHNPTFLQPRGSGSHLLLANRHTLRVRVFGGEVLLALVGFPFFRVASPHLCVFIIAHLVRFVKGFFEIFSKNLFTRGGRYHFHQQSPLTIFIISQTFRLVNTFFEKFLAPSGLHTFLTHCVSNHFGEHPFAFRLCYSLLPTLKGTRLG